MKQRTPEWHAVRFVLLAGLATLFLATGTAHANWLCEGEGDVEILIEKLATDVEQVTITAYTRRYNKAGDEVGPRGSVIHRPGDTLKWGKHHPYLNGKRCRWKKVDEETSP
jgi:hypothetical protein